MIKLVKAYIYRFKFYVGRDKTGDIIWVRRKAEVKILAETEKSYKIRFLQPTYKHKTGYITWVSKRKVKLENTREHTLKSDKEIIAGDINLFCQDLCVCSDCKFCPLRYYKDVGGKRENKKKEKF